MPAVPVPVPTAGRLGARHRLLPILGLLGLLSALLAGCGPAAGTATVPGASISPSSGASAGCPAPSQNAPGASESHLPVRSLCALPPQAAQVWRTIQSGGRLTYSRDGIVFNNAERLLPRRASGYYHEYTVPTPGSQDRGARRLITGQSHEVYYTGDHYASFVVVDTAAVGSG